MTIFNLGSVNVDFVYRLDSLPRPGETLAAHSLDKGLGGKGANQSIAIARADGTVQHIGAVGAQDGWTVEEMQSSGVNADNIVRSTEPSGHAIIYVDQQGENEIVLYQGANWQLTKAQIDQALDTAQVGDWFLLQNETNLGAYGAKAARARGLKVCYSAAPFDLDLVREIIEFTDLLVVNQLEYQQVQQAGLAQSDTMATLVTFGAKGAIYTQMGAQTKVAAYPAVAVDTTGAGDTFLGFALAALDRGAEVKMALQEASAAAAIQVSRRGAAAAIPIKSDVQKFMKDAQ